MYEMHQFFIIALIIALPIFLSIPESDVGIPVVRATFCVSLVIPNALFHEKLSPGIGVDFLAMSIIKFITAIRTLITVNISTSATPEACGPTTGVTDCTTPGTTMGYL